MDNSSEILKKYKSTFKKKEEPKEEMITDTEKRRLEKLAKERDSLLRKYYKKWIICLLNQNHQQKSETQS